MEQPFPDPRVIEILSSLTPGKRARLHRELGEMMAAGRFDPEAPDDEGGAAFPMERPKHPRGPAPLAAAVYCSTR